MFHLICPSLALVLVLPSLTVVAEVLLFFVFRCFFAIVLLPKCYCSSFSVDPRYDIFFLPKCYCSSSSSSVKRPQSILFWGSGINTDQNKQTNFKKNCRIRPALCWNCRQVTNVCCSSHMPEASRT